MSNKSNPKPSTKHLTLGRAPKRGWRAFHDTLIRDIITAFPDISAMELLLILQLDTERKSGSFKVQVQQEYLAKKLHTDQSQISDMIKSLDRQGVLNKRQIRIPQAKFPVNEYDLKPLSDALYAQAKSQPTAEPIPAAPAEVIVPDLTEVDTRDDDNDDPVPDYQEPTIAVKTGPTPEQKRKRKLFIEKAQKLGIYGIHWCWACEIGSSPPVCDKCSRNL